MKAVHFGAGNIGRGFVGLLLHQAGYEVVFADVNAELIDALAATPSYDVHLVGKESTTVTVTGYRALNSAAHEADVIAEIAGADVVTTAVGPNILRFVAPLIRNAVLQRAADAAPLVVMACENAIGATTLLADSIEAQSDADAWATVEERAVFATTAVDRIVPNQEPGSGLDVTVEPYFEWVIEEGPFNGTTLDIPGVTWVPELGPFIERKLFTVNTGHATTAYFGFAEGIDGIADALAVPEIAEKVLAVLRETKQLLVAKYGFEPEVQEAYLQKILGRFSNPYLTDTVQRVGRQPVRKLSRHERFVGPAAELAENGTEPVALLAAIAALLRFDVPEDPQSVELAELLASASADDATATLTGLEPAPPLFAGVSAAVADAQAARA